MHPVTEAPLETVTVEQRHEKLEVFLLAIVRRCCHQQEMAREGPQQLAEPIAFRVLRLGAEDRGGHLVRLVADNKIPATIRRLELLLNVFVAGQFVQPGNGKIRFEKPVAGTGCFELVVGQDFEREMETTEELVLPLLREAARTDDQTTLQIAARYQFLDEQARHDRLPGAGIVGK